MSVNDDLPKLLTLDDVSKTLKVHKETLRRWDRDGKLLAIKVSNRGDRRYKLQDVKLFIEKNKKTK